MSKFIFPLCTSQIGKKVLIISSHPNVGKSFNHVLVQAAKDTLEAAGCAVVVNDLIAIGFNPVGGPHDFIDVANPDFFDYQGEQKRASEGHLYAPDVQHQMDLLSWCDVVIHQYPLYWWSLPAIHKGCFFAHKKYFTKLQLCKDGLIECWATITVTGVETHT